MGIVHTSTCQPSCSSVITNIQATCLTYLGHPNDFPVNPDHLPTMSTHRVSNLKDILCWSREPWAMETRRHEYMRIYAQETHLRNNTHKLVMSVGVINLCLQAQYHPNQLVICSNRKPSWFLWTAKWKPRLERLYPSPNCHPTLERDLGEHTRSARHNDRHRA